MEPESEYVEVSSPAGDPARLTLTATVYPRPEREDVTWYIVDTDGNFDTKLHPGRASGAYRAYNIEVGC